MRRQENVTDLLTQIQIGGSREKINRFTSLRPPEEKARDYNLNVTFHDRTLEKCPLGTNSDMT